MKDEKMAMSVEKKMWRKNLEEKGEERNGIQRKKERKKERKKIIDMNKWSGMFYELDHKEEKNVWRKKNAKEKGEKKKALIVMPDLRIQHEPLSSTFLFKALTYLLKKIIG